MCAMRIRMFKRSLKCRTTYHSVDDLSDSCFVLRPKLITLIDGRTWILRNSENYNAQTGFHESSISGIMYRGIHGTHHLFTELLYITDPSRDCDSKEEYERECGNCQRINPVLYQFTYDTWTPSFYN